MLGVDFFHIDGSRVLQGALDGRFGNLIEQNPVNARGSAIEFFGDMPGNRFPLSIGIRGKIDFVSFLGLGFDLG